MLANTLSKTALDDTTSKDYTKIVQLENGSIFKRDGLPFGDVEELKFSSQITKKGRAETLIDLTYTAVVDPAVVDAAEDYVRVFIKIDKPELVSAEQLTVVTELLDMHSKVLADDTLVGQILNGES